MTWGDSRAHLNHDVLRNQVLNEVMTLQHDAQAECPRLGIWLRNKKAYEELLDQAEAQTSYARILDVDLFDCYDAAMKAEVGDIFHALFLAETHIREKVSECRKTLEAAVRLAESLVGKSDRSPNEVRELSSLLYTLSSQISALPQPVNAGNI